MTKFLRAIGVRIFDYPQLASTLRDRVRERAASLARKPQPAQTVWQPGSMEWLAEQNKPNEPPPLRRLLALVETRELRPATIVSFAGGPTVESRAEPEVRIQFPPAQSPLRTQFGQRRLADEIAAGPFGGSSPARRSAVLELLMGSF